MKPNRFLVWLDAWTPIALVVIGLIVFWSVVGYLLWGWLVVR